LLKAASELKYLDKAMAVVLVFVGGKMIAEYLGYETANRAFGASCDNNAQH
jgi:predicted tellurium resistance membrane protein TerC